MPAESAITPPATPPTIMLVAGENSGDQHGARLLGHLKALVPGIKSFGFGGDAMAAAGMDLDFNLARDLPIIGLSQAVLKYPQLRRLLARAGDLLRQRRPDALVLIDYPGFNLCVAEIAHELGIPVIYYISPQLWAWNHKRIHAIRRTVSLMLVILPFEADLYREAGVPVEYVGHPLMDHEAPAEDREGVLKRLGLENCSPVIGILPGSRQSEVRRHLPVMLDAAELLARDFPQAGFILARAGTIPAGQISEEIARRPRLRVVVADGQDTSVRPAMDFAICKSGTSTLELVLQGIPMVVVYKVSIATELFARSHLRIAHVGLVNIVAGREVAPELLQRDATPARIAAETTRLLRDEPARRAMAEGLDEVRRKIGGSGASLNAAQAIAKFLKARG